jgi:hypothetical protein
MYDSPELEHCFAPAEPDPDTAVIWVLIVADENAHSVTAFATRDDALEWLEKEGLAPVPAFAEAILRSWDDPSDYQGPLAALNTHFKNDGRFAILQCWYDDPFARLTLETICGVALPGERH